MTRRISVDDYLRAMPKTMGKASANDRKIQELIGRRDLDRFAKLPKHSKPTACQPEQDLVRATLQALTMQLGLMCWRNSSGTMPAEYKGKKRFIHMSPAGSPDIFGILPGGTLFGLEGKAKAGKQSEKQKSWGEAMVKRGAKYGVFRSIGEAMSLAREWMGLL